MLAPTGRRLAYPGGHVRTFAAACASCGALTEAGADGVRCRAHLAEALSGEEFHLDPEAPYGLDIYTLRTAATRLGLGVRPTDATDREALLQPHSERAALAGLFALAPTCRGTVSLGLLCRGPDLGPVLESLPPHAAWTDDVAILVDDAPAPPVSRPVSGYPAGAVRIAARPLADDFGAQRNALQALARRPWMLQLDADEGLAAEAGALLPAIAALAEAGAAVSVGLPRANRVDGVLADVYPDVQYRLNRAEVRFTGRVHERPDLGGDWRRGFIALHGAIEHRMSRPHVLARSRRYDGMDPGRGRPEEAEALLRPYRP